MTGNEEQPLSDSDSPLDDVHWGGWSTQNAFRYEAALEAINGAVGAYSALIAHEESKPLPNPEVIAEAEAGQRMCVEHRRTLDADDPEQVAHTRAHFSELIRTLQERIP